MLVYAKHFSITLLFITLFSAFGCAIACIDVKLYHGVDFVALADSPATLLEVDQNYVKFEVPLSQYYSIAYKNGLVEICSESLSATESGREALQGEANTTIDFLSDYGVIEFEDQFQYEPLVTQAEVHSGETPIIEDYISKAQIFYLIDFKTNPDLSQLAEQDNSSVYSIVVNENTFVELSHEDDLFGLDYTLRVRLYYDGQILLFTETEIPVETRTFEAFEETVRDFFDYLDSLDVIALDSDNYDVIISQARKYSTRPLFLYERYDESEVNKKMNFYFVDLPNNIIDVELDVLHTFRDKGFTIDDITFIWPAIGGQFHHQSGNSKYLDSFIAGSSPQLYFTRSWSFYTVACKFWFLFDRKPSDSAVSNNKLNLNTQFEEVASIEDISIEPRTTQMVARIDTFVDIDIEKIQELRNASLAQKCAHYNQESMQLRVCGDGTVFATLIGSFSLGNLNRLAEILTGESTQLLLEGLIPTTSFNLQTILKHTRYYSTNTGKVTQFEGGHTNFEGVLQFEFPVSIYDFQIGEGTITYADNNYYADDWISIDPSHINASTPIRATRDMYFRFLTTSTNISLTPSDWATETTPILVADISLENESLLYPQLVLNISVSGESVEPGDEFQAQFFVKNIGSAVAKEIRVIPNQSNLLKGFQTESFNLTPSQERVMNITLSIPSSDKINKRELYIPSFEVEYSSEDEIQFEAESQRIPFYISLSALSGIDVLIVTSETELYEKFGPYTEDLKQAIMDFEFSLDNDDYKATTLFLDDENLNTELGIKPCTTCTYQEADAIIEKAINLTNAEYLIIIGNHEVIPFGILDDPTHDDADIATDDIYGDINHDELLLPDLYVGRIPTMNDDEEGDALISILKRYTALHNEKKKRELRNWTAVTTATWKSNTEYIFGDRFKYLEVLHESPPVGWIFSLESPKKRYVGHVELLNGSLLTIDRNDFLNFSSLYDIKQNHFLYDVIHFSLHGNSDIGVQYLGGEMRLYQKTLGCDYIESKGLSIDEFTVLGVAVPTPLEVRRNALFVSISCWGAMIEGREGSKESIPLYLLKSNASAFIGSTRMTYMRDDTADLFTKIFYEKLDSMTPGEALKETKTDYWNRNLNNWFIRLKREIEALNKGINVLNAPDYKILHEYILYGDPTW